MDISQVIADVTKTKKDFETTLKILKDVSRLDAQRTYNIRALRTRVAKLERSLDRYEHLPGLQVKLREWIEEYKKTLQDSEVVYRQRFGTELELELKKSGYSLSGQIPDLRSGLFTFELNFDKSKVVLWYGPKQERLGSCQLPAARVAQCLQSEQDNLGSHLSVDDFVDRLKTVCTQVSNKVGEPTPIITTYTGVARLLAQSMPDVSTGAKKVSKYTRADFSYDLFRSRSEPRLRLRVAVRAYTTSRQTFLWVPDDDSGAGTTYSHVQIMEVMP
jgi:hypothetical protein